MESRPYQAHCDSLNRSTASVPQNTPADQQHPGSDHNATQLTQDHYVIHDMAIKAQQLDSRVLTVDEQDVAKMLDDLEDEIFQHQPSNTFSPETASSEAIEQPLRNGAENNRLEDLSWALRRWKSQLFEALPSHCCKLVSDTTGGGPHNKELAGTYDGDGAADADEEVWSNKASAGAGDEDTEEKLAGTTAN
jgi:hypothetical protein